MVRCKDCGLLTLRNRVSRELIEADQLYRRNPRGVEIAHIRHDGVPLCFARVFDLAEEFNEADQNRARRANEIAQAEEEARLRQGLRPRIGIVTESEADRKSEAARTVTARERDCVVFTPWRQGFAPKEHLEMLDREERRRWQEEQRAADLRWREQQRREDKWWRVIELIVLAGIATLIAGGFTLLGAFIQRGTAP